MNENDEIRELLESLAEPDFQKFASSLIPNIPSESVLGVRLPRLRKIAKQIARSDWRDYLDKAQDLSFEETMLQGMVIGYVREPLQEIKRRIAWFVPKIDNWSVCDSFCSGLKITKDYPDEMWEFIVPYVQSDEEYGIRFGVVMILFYYVDSVHMEEAFRLLDAVQYDSYYVKMAVAWAVSIYYLSFPKETLAFLSGCSLDDFTYNKSLQKITESKKVSADTKEEIRRMKRK